MVREAFHSCNKRLSKSIIILHFLEYYPICPFMNMGFSFPQNHITSASCTSWSHTYSYDKTGNRTAKDGVTHTINSVNEVTALSDGTSFTYDSNGNRTQKTKGSDTWSYTYDYANRLTKVEKNSVTLGEYVYDGDGKRMQVTENNETTTYIYSGMNTLYEENTTGTACYIYGPKGQLAKRTTINEESNMFYYHTDHLGSTRLVTDENKNIVSATTYHLYGEPDAEEGTEEYLFTGKEQDATGLYYYGVRYYDPEIGRFLTRDPLKGERREPQTLNRYAYCLNNPLKYIDPTGTEEESKNAQKIVEEVFESLQDVDPDDLAEVQDLIDAENYLEALEMMMKLLGYECWQNDDGSLTVIIEEEEWTMIIDNELKDEKSGIRAWGKTDHDNNTIFLNFSSKKVGDIILSALHEVCHAILGGTTFKAIEKEHEFIFGVEFNYMIALNAQGVEFSQDFKDSIIGDAFVYSSHRIGLVSVQEISKKWIQGWKKC